MHRIFLSLIAVLTLSSLLLVASSALAFEADHDPAWSGPVVRQQEHEDETATGSEREVLPVVLWSSFGVGLGVIVFTALYMLKRRIGGFPANPEWVAPITIMLSKDASDEGTYGEPSEGHGHASAH